MEDAICLDTTILADLLRNKSYAVKWFKEQEEKCVLATTIVNIFELYYGAYKSPYVVNEIKAVEELIKRLLILNFSVRATKEAGKQKAQLEKDGKTIEFRDVFIGAISLVENFAFKTNNKKHFERIMGLR